MEKMQIKCESCNGYTKIESRKEKIFCEHCGSQMTLEDKKFFNILSDNELKEILYNMEDIGDVEIQREFLYLLKKLCGSFDSSLQSKVNALIVLEELKNLKISSKNFYAISEKELYNELLEKIKSTADKIDGSDMGKINEIKKLYSRNFIIKKISYEINNNIELTHKISFERVQEINKNYPNISLTEQEKNIVGSDIEKFIDRYMVEYNNKIRNNYIYFLEKQNEASKKLFQETNTELFNLKRELNVTLFTENDLKYENTVFNDRNEVNRVREYRLEQENLKAQEEKELELLKREKNFQKLIKSGAGIALIGFLIYGGWSFSVEPKVNENGVLVANESELKKENEVYYSKGLFAKKYEGIIHLRDRDIVISDGEISEYKDGLAKVQKDNKYGIVDNNGKSIVPVEYDSIGEYKDGLAIVQKVNKYGVVDNNGKLIAPVEYDSIGEYKDGLAKIRKGNQSGELVKNGKEINMRAISKNFVLVPGGEFVPTFSKNKITMRPYLMEKYEVTQKQYESLMGNNPSYFKGKNRPVENVSWIDGLKYANALSEKDGFTPVYKLSGSYILRLEKIVYSDGKEVDPDKADFSKTDGYRLPTEVEWEFAAKSSNLDENTKYVGSDNANEVAVYARGVSQGTADVGTKKPNKLGLYDMSGNVYEWVYDSYSYSDKISDSKPYIYTNVGSGESARGGSWYSNARMIETSDRPAFIWPERNRFLNHHGFRLVRSL